MNPSTKVLALFSLAVFISASVCSSYSVWVDSLYRANNEAKAESSNFLAPGYDPAKIDQIWEAENTRINKYATRNRQIVYLSFPLALTFALLAAIVVGWLPRFPVLRMFAALIPVYLAPGLVIVLGGLFWGLFQFPLLALAAFLIRLSIEILTSHRPKRFVLTLLISVVLCSLLYVVVVSIFGRNGEPFASAIFVVGIETIAAGLYGKSLTTPSGFVRQPATVFSAG